jgi:hypothetical protein
MGKEKVIVIDVDADICCRVAYFYLKPKKWF